MCRFSRKFFPVAQLFLPAISSGKHVHPLSSAQNRSALEAVFFGKAEWEEYREILEADHDEWDVVDLPDDEAYQILDLEQVNEDISWLKRTPSFERIQDSGMSEDVEWEKVVVEDEGWEMVARLQGGCEPRAKL